MGGEARHAWLKPNQPNAGEASKSGWSGRYGVVFRALHKGNLPGAGLSGRRGTETGGTMAETTEPRQNKVSPPNGRFV